jgi:hypothetical protein
MLIKVGTTFPFQLKAPMPIVAMLYVHPSRQKLYVSPFHLVRSLPRQIPSSAWLPWCFTAQCEIAQ